MRITSYDFGRIVIDGRTYDKDVIILPETVVSPWWRAEGHVLTPADLDDVVAAAPEVLGVGTGEMGVMKVPEETVKFLEVRGIEVTAMRTGDAVQEFNRLSQGRKAAAALHLTC